MSNRLSWIFWWMREEASQNHQSSTGRPRVTIYWWLLWKCYLVSCHCHCKSSFVWVGLWTDGACTGHHLECVIIITVIITIIISIIKLVSVLSEPTQQPTPINPPPHLSAGSLWTIWNTHYTHMHMTMNEQNQHHIAKCERIVGIRLKYV